MSQPDPGVEQAIEEARRKLPPEVGDKLAAYIDGLEAEMPAAARKVIPRLYRVPWVWDLILEELEAEENREPQSHFRLRLDLMGQFGKVVTAAVALKRKRRK